MWKEQDLVISLELTCRGSTWIPLKLNSLDIQAPWLPCLQPGDESRFGEWPHCRREKKGMWLDSRWTRQNYSPEPSQDWAPEGRRGSPGGIQGSQGRMPRQGFLSDSSEQRQDSSVQFSHSVMSDPLQTHELQHVRPPCPSPTPGVYPNSCPLSWWCHPTISSSVIPFSSCPQSFPASGSFQMSQLFASGGQSTGVSASTWFLPMNIQDWSPLGWTGWTSLQSKGLSRVFSNTTVQRHQFFGTRLSL